MSIFNDEQFSTTARYIADQFTLQCLHIITLNILRFSIPPKTSSFVINTSPNDGNAICIFIKNFIFSYRYIYNG